MTTLKGRRAWLVTWESVGPRATVDQPIAAVLSIQTGAESVRVFVERLYASHHFTGAEMLEALPPKGHNPYRARYGSVQVEQGGFAQAVPFTGQVVCGHNPHLYARQVAGLRVGVGTYDDGSPRLAWTEPQHPGTLHMPDSIRAAPLDPTELGEIAAE
jgi:hypothetical protein